MMNSKTYISDPKLWEAFYKNMAEKKFNPYKYKPKTNRKGYEKAKILCHSHQTPFTV